MTTKRLPCPTRVLISSNIHGPPCAASIIEDALQNCRGPVEVISSTVGFYSLWTEILASFIFSSTAQWKSNFMFSFFCVFINTGHMEKCWLTPCYSIIFQRWSLCCSSTQAVSPTSAVHYAWWYHLEHRATKHVSCRFTPFQPSGRAILGAHDESVRSRDFGSALRIRAKIILDKRTADQRFDIWYAKKASCLFRLRWRSVRVVLLG